MTKTQGHQLFAREDAERLARKTGATVLVQEYDTPPLYRCNVEHDPAGGIIVAIVPPPHGHAAAPQARPRRPRGETRRTSRPRGRLARAIRIASAGTGPRPRRRPGPRR